MFWTRVWISWQFWDRVSLVACCVSVVGPHDFGRSSAPGTSNVPSSSQASFPLGANMGLEVVFLGTNVGQNVFRCHRNGFKCLGSFGCLAIVRPCGDNVVSCFSSGILGTCASVMFA